MLDFETDQHLQLSRSVYATQWETNKVLIGSNIYNFTQVDLTEELIVRILEDLANGCSTNELKSRFPNDLDTLEAILVELIRKGLLEMDTPELPSALLRFDRQILFLSDTLNTTAAKAIELQKKIMTTNVAVLGVGGVGSYVVRTLAAMGFGTITILDFDIVEESNISRQVFYDYRDIGKQKVDVIEAKIPDIAPNCKVVKFNMKVRSLEDLKEVLSEVDVCVAAIDTPRVTVNEIVAKIPFELDVPTVYGGSVTNNVMYGPTVKKGHSSCFMCVRGLHSIKNLEESSDLVNRIASNYTTTLIDPINTMAASVMAMEVTKLTTGIEAPMFNRSNMMTLSDYNVTQFRQDEASDCPVCSQYKKVTA
jgi:molybdopterin/thiamine biosynthesis adenylyltransferase